MEGGWSQAGKLQALQIFMLSVFFSRGLRGKMTRNIGIASAILAIHSQLQALELSSCILNQNSGWLLCRLGLHFINLAIN